MMNVWLGLLAALLVPSTSAVPFQKRIVYSPPILSPTADTVWVIGQSELVSWDASDLPAELYNATGVLVSGYLEPSDDNEHLDNDSPLAKGFLLREGQTTITVPDTLEPRTNAIVVLFGDSGNKSPTFTIAAASSASASGSASASPSPAGEL